jgi:hypothetical protein
MFEGDARLLDGWLTQSEMFLRAYNVDLSTSRSVDVATMFLRGKAQDWWTGQFHLIAAGSIPALNSWHAFVGALTEAFRPVELSRTYVTQLLSISQGKQDMRGYIASFNALRAKIPHAFPEETLSLLFLQGCRPDLQRHISLLYPKSLAEHFQHAITISDIPVSSRPPAAGGRSTGTAREADSSLKKRSFVTTAEGQDTPKNAASNSTHSSGHPVLIRKRPNIRGFHAVGSSGIRSPS